VTVAQAVEAYLADAASRSVEASTLKKLETIFRKQFLAWTRVQGFEYLDELDLVADANVAIPLAQRSLSDAPWALKRNLTAF
jgi:hypothetical protein